MKWLSPEILGNPVVRLFAEKVKCVVNPDWHSIILDQVRAQGTFLRIPTELEVKARGNQFTAYAEYAKGDPWGPYPVSDEEIANRFGSLTDGLVGRQKAAEAVQAAFDLDRASDVRKLVSALHP